MNNVGRLYIDTNLLTSLLNFPPEHGIVDMGYDPQSGGYLIVSGPSLPMSDGSGAIPEVALQSNFFGSQFAMPETQAPAEQQIGPRNPFPGI